MRTNDFYTQDHECRVHKMHRLGLQEIQDARLHKVHCLGLFHIPKGLRQNRHRLAEDSGGVRTERTIPFRRSMTQSMAFASLVHLKVYTIFPVWT